VALLKSLALHSRNVIHCAVTPEHVLLNSELSAGERPNRVLLTGFETAVEASSGERLLDHQAVLPDNMAYLASEQTGRMARRVDYRADFYGLGATLYEALCGHAPFAGRYAAEAAHAHLALPVPDLLDFCPTANPALAAVIHCLLSKDPESRYQTHAGLLRDVWDIDRAHGRGEVLDAFIPATSDYPRHLQLSPRDRATLLNPSATQVSKPCAEIPENHRHQAVAHSCDGNGDSKAEVETYPLGQENRQRNKQGQ
jgi:serine/threonine protein kinase